MDFSSNNQVVLRHDIDFDVQLARDIAEIEFEENIKSTYFFLISSDSYNILNTNNYNDIIRIKDMGHKISLHFDPVNYVNFEHGLEKEVKIFENLFEVKIDIISLHRPNNFFLNLDSEINGIEHTYQQKYFSKIKYFADSRGYWRYGNPIESDEFKNGNNLHILTHPIWWAIDGGDAYDILKNYFNYKKEKLKEHYAYNCLPFREIKNEIK